MLRISFCLQQHIISLPLNMLKIRANKWVKLRGDDIFGRQPSLCQDQSEVALSSAPLGLSINNSLSLERG